MSVPRMLIARARTAPGALRAFPVRFGPWLRSLRPAAEYSVLGEAELRATRRSDTVFVFGSGASLNELTAGDWQHIGEHDTLGFNWFVHERFVRCDYHLIREVAEDDFARDGWRVVVASYFGLIRDNPCYRDTVFLVQKGFRAINGNRAIAYRLLPAGARIFRWRSRVYTARPSTALADGLTHGYGTLGECVNFAYVLGWRRIVLAGVDLYDRRYFWLAGDAVRDVHGGVPDDPHPTSDRMVDLVGDWAEMFRVEGVDLYVLNPCSLLARRLPVYDAPSMSGERS